MTFPKGFIIGIGCFGLLGASAVTAGAQEVAQSFHELAGTLKPGATVSITNDLGGTLRGKIVELSPSSLTLRTSDGSRTLEQARVRQVALVRHDTKKGALAGMALGAIGGFFTMLAACGDCGDQGVGFAMGGAVLFGGIGAGVGAGVGASRTHEQLVYRAPVPQSDSAFAVRPFVSPHGSGLAAVIRF